MGKMLDMPECDEADMYRLSWAIMPSPDTAPQAFYDERESRCLSYPRNGAAAGGHVLHVESRFVRTIPGQCLPSIDFRQTKIEDLGEQLRRIV
jgi:hypothetical protein